MAIIKSKVDVKSSDFQDNYEHFQKVLEEHREILDSIRSGNPKAMEKHLERGKIPARQRIKMILDPDTPFMELSSLAAYNLYDNAAPYAGIVTGIGLVAGREIMVEHFYLFKLKYFLIKNTLEEYSIIKLKCHQKQYHK